MKEEKEPVCMCDGKETIRFRGKGLNLQYMICPMVGSHGHKTMEECDAEYRKRRAQNYPASGRFA
jgi:hypothetical protein